MSTERKLFCILMLLVFFLPALAARAQDAKKTAPGPDHQKIEDQFTQECKSIFETKCAQCHPMDKITATKKGADWWASCAVDMSKKPGANLSKDDLAHILYYILKEMPQALP